MLTTNTLSKGRVLKTTFDVVEIISSKCVRVALRSVYVVRTLEDALETRSCGMCRAVNHKQGVQRHMRIDKQFHKCQDLPT